MHIFLFFCTMYGAAHLYLFFKVRSAFPLSAVSINFLGLFLIFMALSPFLVHLSSLKASENFSKVFAYVSYIWVAILLLFFAAAVSLDLYNLLVRLSGLILQKDFGIIIFSPLYIFFIPLFLAIIFTAYGYFEAKDLRVERLTVITSKLPEGINKLTIVQISDIHLGIIVREEMLDKVIKEIKNAKPDMIVSTGDLLDGEINHVDYLAERLKRVPARLGKFAVTGNHEFFGGIKHALKFIEDAGFTILRGRGLTVQGVINIAGVDDSPGKNVRHDEKTKFESEREILSKLPSNIFTLLLKHKPNVNKDALGLFDLQLSGHTHGGQIFPVHLAIGLFFPHYNGYRELSKGAALYVSRGAGTAGPPMRLLSPPELTVIEVVSAKSEISEKNQDSNNF